MKEIYKEKQEENEKLFAQINHQFDKDKQSMERLRRENLQLQEQLDALRLELKGKNADLEDVQDELDDLLESMYALELENEVYLKEELAKSSKNQSLVSL